MAGIRVHRYDDPSPVLARAGEFLRSRPVEHNLVLRLLTQRVDQPEPGRYWVVEQADGVAGVVFNSPLDFMAALTPMNAEAAVAAADAVSRTAPDLSGASGEAGTTARFAGQWTESTGTGVRAAFGQRLYEFAGSAAASEPDGRGSIGAEVPGRLRLAISDDRDTLVTWHDHFRAEIGPSGPARDSGALIDRRMEGGDLWVWEVDGGPVSLVGISDPVAGVSCIGPVYTPPEQRSRGFAQACVGTLTTAIASRGDRAILYTELLNPTSNRIYRRIGYRAVVECLAYDFTPARDGSVVG